MIRRGADLIRQALDPLSRLETIPDTQGDMIDPLHGVCTAVQNVSSIFAERVSGHIEFKATTGSTRFSRRACPTSRPACRMLQGSEQEFVQASEIAWRSRPRQYPGSALISCMKRRAIEQERTTVTKHEVAG